MSAPIDLPIKDRVGPPLQVSKWIKLPVLIDLEEMKSLLASLGPFSIFLTSGMVKQGEGRISQAEFEACYQMYIEALKGGELPTHEKIRPYFSSIFTNNIESVYTVLFPNQQQLIKPDKPVIQLQHHTFNYSTVDGKFRSMVLGSDSIGWGIQFSYPQLYQDTSMQIRQVRNPEEFPNTRLFQQLQRWVRHHTYPVPFEVNHQRIHVPIRLGKNCFSWINHHPQLAAKGLKVLHP